ncbi:MAG: hypothetical protein GF329_00745, partial [Candidatus Lokiarchaeota archaeon]|nr:hypothetical protein [Candidatus Lokiarchaeota archaeon]
MVTPESQAALDNLRNLSNFNWVFITLLLIVLYIYINEYHKKNYDIIFGALGFYGMDIFNEIWNSLVLHGTSVSALWISSVDNTMLIIFVGLNVEITMMFAILGIVFLKMLPSDKKKIILKIPNRWFYAILCSALAMVIEMFLNYAGLLLWHYPFWNFSFPWLIIPIGYLHFFIIAFWIHDMKKRRNKIAVLSVIYI